MESRIVNLRVYWEDGIHTIFRNVVIDLHEELWSMEVYHQDPPKRMSTINLTTVRYYEVFELEEDEVKEEEKGMSNELRSYLKDRIQAIRHLYTNYEMSKIFGIKAGEISNLKE